MLDVSFPIAFTAGLVSFFAPCVIPLLPAYIAYLTGVSPLNLQRVELAPYLKKLLVASFFFSIGFSLVFVILGTAAFGLGAILRRYDDVVRIIGGTLILIFGASSLGLFSLPRVSFANQLALPKWAERLWGARPFLIGIIFATTWTSCVGVVLGSILALAAISKTVLSGALLLFVYSLGILFPFVVSAVAIAALPHYFSSIKKHSGAANKVAGLLLIVLGVLLITDTYKYLNSFVFEVARAVGYRG